MNAFSLRLGTGKDDYFYSAWCWKFLVVQEERKGNKRPACRSHDGLIENPEESILKAKTNKWVQRGR